MSEYGPLKRCDRCGNTTWELEFCCPRCLEMLKEEEKQLRAERNDLAARLIELDEIHRDDDGELVWLSSGDYVGGAVRLARCEACNEHINTGDAYDRYADDVYVCAICRKPE